MDKKWIDEWMGELVYYRTKFFGSQRDGTGD